MSKANNKFVRHMIFSLVYVVLAVVMLRYDKYVSMLCLILFFAETADGKYDNLNDYTEERLDLQRQRIKETDRSVDLLAKRVDLIQRNMR